MSEQTWVQKLGSFSHWYDNLPDSQKEDVVRHVINARPAGRKIRDIMGIPKGAQAFDLDIVDGVEGEDIVNDMRQSWIAGTVEVKRDYAVSTTQNVAVEYSCSGRESGIARTKASWISYLLDGDMYCGEVAIIMRPSRLRRIANRCRTTTGGDGNRAEMALVPVTRLVMPLPGGES